MVNQNHPATELPRESKPRDKRVTYSAGLQTRTNPDEVIRALSNARENRRARQVVEWEHLAHQSAGRVY